MSGFSVRPEHLHVPAAQCDRASRALADAARTVLSVVVPTGSVVSDQQCGLTMQQLAGALRSLAHQVDRDGAAVRGAAVGYAAVDGRAVGP